MSKSAGPQYTRLVLYLPSQQNLLLSGEWKTLRGLGAVSDSLRTSCDIAGKVPLQSASPVQRPHRADLASRKLRIATRRKASGPCLL